MHLTAEQIAMMQQLAMADKRNRHFNTEHNQDGFWEEFSHSSEWFEVIGAVQALKAQQIGRQFDHEIATTIRF